jgi:asparaginyl-tRNA synthetase
VLPSAATTWPSSPSASRRLRSPLEALIAKPFARIDYTDAVDMLKKSGKKFDYPVEWGRPADRARTLADRGTRRPPGGRHQLSGKHQGLLHAPERRRPTVAAMDVLAPGIGEIIGGSQREERLDMLDRAWRSSASIRRLCWYRDFRRYGTVPHAGFGLGFERLVVYVCGLANIRDAIPTRARRAARTCPT